MPSEDEPIVRTRHVQEWLQQVAKEDEPWRGRFFQALPRKLRETIENAPRLSWLPIETHVQLADLMLETFGLARAHAYYRRSFTQALRGPIFDALVKTGVRVLGVSPAAFLRWANKGWELSFRNCGRVEGKVLGPEHGLLIYSGLPQVCTASDAWLDSAQGSAYGALDLLEVQGVVRLDKRARDRGGMQLELEWNQRSPTT